MGFKLERKAYRLTFADGTDLDGASVTLGSLSVGELQALEGAGVSTSQEAEARLEQQLALVADRLVAWDLEDEQGPLPMTVEGLKRLEVGHWRLIVSSWMEAVTQVAPPLPEPSSSGVTSPVPPIPMESLSSSPGS